MLDEHISWENHIKTVESKLTKNIGLLIPASWTSTYVTKLNTIHLLQKQAVRFVFNEGRLSH